MLYPMAKKIDLSEYVKEMIFQKSMLLYVCKFRRKMNFILSMQILLLQMKIKI